MKNLEFLNKILEFSSKILEFLNKNLELLSKILEFLNKILELQSKKYPLTPTSGCEAKKLGNSRLK